MNIKGKLHKKGKIIYSVLLVLVMFFLVSCRQKTPQEYISEAVGLDCSEGVAIVYERNYGGFPIDGHEYGELEFSNESLEEEIRQSENWNELPLKGNVSTIVYGYEESSDAMVVVVPSRFMDYSDPLSAPKPRIPEIEHGYYYFEDKLSEGEARRDGSLVFSREADYDYIVAIYDIDTKKLYFGAKQN